MWAQHRVRVVSSQIGRCNHELKALRVGGGRAVTLIHVAAANPFRTRSDPNLIAGAVIPNCRACRVGAVTIIVTRLQCIWATRAAARMDSVMPVEVVVSANTIPAAITVFQRDMRPARARIELTHNDAIPGESQCPN